MASDETQKTPETPLEKPKRKSRRRKDFTCPVCSKEMSIPRSDTRKFCSPTCASKNASKFLVTREELETLIWNMPTTAVAKMYGVSDTAINKRCRRMGIEKPPRGYWRRVETGYIKQLLPPSQRTAERQTIED